MARYRGPRTTEVATVLQGAVRRSAQPRWMDMAIDALRDWKHKEFKDE